MSRILKDINELVKACYPKSEDEALKLWHDIRPIRFYGRVSWTIAQEYQLAQFSVPDDAAYLVVLRVDNWIVTNVATAAGYGDRIPIPSNALFETRWTAAPGGSTTDASSVTGAELSVGLLDVDEFLFFKAGNTVRLLSGLPANPTADARDIHTVVYSYILGPMVADKLGSDEVSVTNA